MDARQARLPTWHEGEKILQERLGVAQRMEPVGQRVVRDHMPEQHRGFYAQLPFIVLGAVDAQGKAWATFIEGRPGFISSPAPTMLDIAAWPAPADPARAGMAAGSAVGLLGIEMHTRRRNRMNGTLLARPQGFGVQVDQSFGNCPRYIRLRDAAFAREPGQAGASAPEDMPALDAAARAMIGQADAFFVASYADRPQRRQVDVSYRGGKPGFVRVAEDGTLTIPDFNGNLFFATLGNILLNGKAGLLFVDFDTGDMLQLTGQAELVLESPEIAAFEGAERLWTFRTHRAVRRRGALALRWRARPDGQSPHALMTGDWRQAAERLQSARLASHWRRFKVERIVQESASIRSLHLRPDDGAGLAPYQAGQHLPIRVTLPGSDRPLVRTYTLSSAPSDGSYRISVKRDGRVSQYLHGLRVNDAILARAPAGRFVIDAGTRRTAVLLAGGVGITPLLSMLRHLVHEGLRTQRMRPAMLFHAARTRQERAFDQELDGLVAAAGGALKRIRVLGDVRDARAGIDYDAADRIDMALLGRFLPFGDYDFYLCGPAPFTQSIYDGLRDYGVTDARIHAEAFGPSSLQRRPDTAPAAPAPPAAATGPVQVVFAQAGRQAQWTPQAGTLLALAEQSGLAPGFGCRAGTCGTCSTGLLEGAVAYAKAPAAMPPQGQVLLCCAVPALGPAGDSAARIRLAL